MTLEVALKLQQLRKEKGLSQEELADKLGVSRQAVSKWERAEASPDTDNLILLAKLYNVSLDELLGVPSSSDQKKTDRASQNGEGAPPERESENSDNGGETDKKGKRIIAVLNAVLASATLIAYLLIGGIGGAWHPWWLLFFIIPIGSSLIEAIYKRNATLFAYPVLVALTYLILGVNFDLWHPWWVLFFTIFAYYPIASLFKKERK